MLAVRSIMMQSVMVRSLFLIAGGLATAWSCTGFHGDVTCCRRIDAKSFRAGNVYRQSQPFIETDRRSPSRRQGLGDVELHRADNTVIRFRVSADTEQRTQYKGSAVETDGPSFQLRLRSVRSVRASKPVPCLPPEKYQILPRHGRADPR